MHFTEISKAPLLVPMIITNSTIYTKLILLLISNEIPQANYFYCEELNMLSADVHFLADFLVTSDKKQHQMKKKMLRVRDSRSVSQSNS